MSQVARRYDVNANQVFTWLRDPRFAPVAEPDVVEPAFLPVEIIPDAGRPVGAATVAAPTIEMTLPTGVALTIQGTFDPDAVVRLVRGLGA